MHANYYYYWLPFVDFARQGSDHLLHLRFVYLNHLLILPVHQLYLLSQYFIDSRLTICS